MRGVILSLFFFLLTAFSAQAITIDGNLSDWGLDTSSFGENGNDWSQVNPGVFVWQEDCVGYDCPGADRDDYVGPGYGGQTYDVEAILATLDDSYLYIAIVTGFPLEGYNGYEVGDIFIDVNLQDDAWDYAFVLKNHDSFRAGNIYEVKKTEDVKYSQHAVSNPWRVASGGLMDGGDFEYVDDPDHAFSRYFIEAKVPVYLLGSLSGFKIHWTMECGNDYGELVAHAPEPASILLLGAGLFAVGLMVKRRKS